VAYPGVGSESLFGRQLALLARELCLPMPIFKGRKMPNITHGVDRWEIQTTILGDLADPTSQHVLQ
jgi:hypothetical protein